ncbi:MAG: pseudouridine synthase [bacterium]|nr:pseudouridine synthase [bacterium]
MASERLQKVLAAAGICSRRTGEVWIHHGRITVNGKRVELGTKVDPEKDKVCFEGQTLFLAKKVPPETIVLYKPENCLVTRKDPEKRTTIYELLPENTKLLPIGRLDFDSEGLLLMTTDRSLIHQLTHPKFEVPRTYEVKVKGAVSQETLKKIGKGVTFQIGESERDIQYKKEKQTFQSGPAKVRLMKENPHNCWIEIVLREGRNREVRRIFEAMGHSVLRLKRTSFGPVHLGKLVKGKSRPLTPQETAQLLQKTSG